MNTLAIRLNGINPDHHLWNNNGTWWCHYTVHLPDFTKQRVRLSLRTACRKIAHFRRDQHLQNLRTSNLRGNIARTPVVRDQEACKNGSKQQ